MSDLSPNFTQVKIEFSPYNHNTVQSFLRGVYSDFGHNRNRWHYTVNSYYDDSWTLDFKFVHPHDAIMFSLKYSR